MSERATATHDQAPTEACIADALMAENQQLKDENAQLRHQLDLLQRLVFGQKSERHIPPNPDQLTLGEVFKAPEDLPEPEKQTITYERGKAPKDRPDGCVSDSGLRFDESVPVKTIELSAPEIAGLNAEQYEIIDVKVTHRLAQRPASYVVLRYERPVVKLIETQKVLMQVPKVVAPSGHRLYKVRSIRAAYF